MSFLAILIALLFEQVRPLKEGNGLHALMRSWALWVRQNLDAGQERQAWAAWTLAVGVPALLALVLHWALMWFVGWPLAMLWNMVVLYLTLGFRQFSHHFTEIRDALEAGDEAKARELFAAWQQVDASTLPRHEIVRHVIEHSVVAAHRHVFGVLTVYSVLAALGLGPAGAVLYRMGEFVARLWHEPGQPADAITPSSEALQEVSSRAWQVLDWVPARMTALSFAVVGNFEDAVDCWRSDAQRFPNLNDGVVLAATSGAINIRMGGEGLRKTSALASDEPLHQESTTGREPEVAHLRSVVGLVWRTVVMWVVLLALLTLARLLG